MFRRQRTPARVAPPREAREALPSPSKLPRSITLNVLSSIKSTFSRPSISGNVVEDDELQGLHESIQTSFSRADLRKDAMLGNGFSSSPFQDITNGSPPAATSYEPSRSLSSYDDVFQVKRQRRSSSSDDLEDDPGCTPSHVRTAMPDQYWSGRFVGLHDRFHNETHEEQLEIISQLSADMYPTLFHEGSNAINSEQEQYTRARRVFIRLELSCATREARASLWGWQQKYARKVNNHALLPRRGTMGDILYDPARSPRKVSAPFPSRTTSFGTAAEAGRRKTGSLGNEDADYGEENTLIDHTTVKQFVPRQSPTRLPPPTFPARTRSDLKPLQQTSSRFDAVKSRDGFGFGRKTSVGYVNSAPGRDKDQKPRRGTSFGMTRDTSVPSLPKPSFSIKRDFSIQNLSRSTRPPPYHAQSANDTNKDQVRRMSKEKSVSNFGRIESQSRGLTRNVTIGDLSPKKETKPRSHIPRTSSIGGANTLEAQINKFAPRRNISIQSLTTSSPAKQRPSLPNSASFTSRPQNIYNSSNNIAETQKKKTPLYPNPPPLPRDRTFHSLNVSRFFTPNGSRRPRVSNGSAYSGSGGTPSILEECEAPDDDIDVWNSKSKMKTKGRQSSLGRDDGRKPRSENGTAPSAIEGIDALGAPQWDDRGYPYYYFDGKRQHVPSKAAITTTGGGGSGRVYERIITEDRVDTWKRLVKKREARREKDRRMVEEGREIERRVSGVEFEGAGGVDDAGFV